MNLKITPEVEKILVEMLSRGLPVPCAAQFIGVRETAIHRWRRRRGKDTDLQVKQAHHLLLKWMQLNEMSRKNFWALRYLLQVMEQRTLTPSEKFHVAGEVDHNLRAGAEFERALGAPWQTARQLIGAMRVLTDGSSVNGITPRFDAAARAALDEAFYAAVAQSEQRAASAEPSALEPGAGPPGGEAGAG